MSTIIQNSLLNVLNTIIESKKATIYGASKSLIKIYPNAVIFEFISILAYNKDKEILEQLKSISVLDFYKAITDFKIKAYNFFIDCVKEKKFEDNTIVVQKLLELINTIPSDSIVLKYINMIKPLIEMLDQTTQLKMKLYIMIPNTYNIFYSKISKEYALFPQNAIDFYSYMNLKSNTKTIKTFVEKNNKASIDFQKNYTLSYINDKISKVELDLAKKYEELKLENKETNSKYEELNSKYEELNLKHDRLQKNLYQINFRDSIKSFLDELMDALGIFHGNSSSHSMKISEIKTKINSLIAGLKEEEKKCAILLLNTLDYLQTLNEEGDNLSHYYNNLGFDVEILPKNVKEKYLLYGNGNTNYDCISLVSASLDGYIEENEQLVLNQFLHDIYLNHKNKDEIITSIKEHSKRLLL